MKALCMFLALSSLAFAGKSYSAVVEIKSGDTVVCSGSGGGTIRNVTFYNFSASCEASYLVATLRFTDDFDSNEKRCKNIAPSVPYNTQGAIYSYKLDGVCTSVSALKFLDACSRFL